MLVRHADPCKCCLWLEEEAKGSFLHACWMRYFVRKLSGACVRKTNVWRLVAAHCLLGGLGETNYYLAVFELLEIYFQRNFYADEYDVSNVPSVDPAPHLVRQSRTGTGRAAKPIDLTADDKAEERGKKAGKGGKQGGGPSRLHGRSPVRSPAREE
eukprot:scaffold63850_cov14-Tisochrysis_lutea.AAC.1